VVAAPGVLANDVTYGGGAMTAALVTGAGNGAVTLNANGGFSYTPDPRFSGADTFTYRAVNAAGPGNAAAVTVTVVPPRPTTTRVGLYTTYRAPAISADDRWVAFASGDTNGRTDVFVYDRQTATTTLASVGPGGVGGNGFSDEAAISADGRSVAFSSSASNLVAGDTNGSKDVFVRDRQAAATTRVSVGTGGTQGNNASYSPAISADGRWVAFASSASNLVAGDLNNVDDVFVHDRQTGTTTPVSVGPAGAQALSASRSPAISADGRWVAFDSGASNLVAGDTNGADDVFVHDRQTGATTRVSVGPGGAQANAGSYDAALSADGRWVAFVSYASNLVAGDTNGARDVFVHDQQTGATTHVSMGTYLSISPAISADGRWVAFARERHFPTQLNVWLHDRQTGETTVVAAGSLPRPFIDLGPSSGSPAISADGGWVAFVSMASDLVPDDTNDATDVFVYGRDRGCAVTLAPTFASAPAAGATGGVSVLASAGCGWTAVSDDPGWLIVTDDASGTGSAAIKYHVTANAGVPRTGTVTIAGQTFTVTQLAPPTTVPDTYATTFNTPLVITAPGVLANDRPNNGGAMSATLVDPPANGTVALDPSGAFTYTPTFGFSGADAFSYRALTSSGSGNVAAVSITVAAAMGPLPPVGLVAHSVFGNIVTLRWTNPSVGPAPTNFVLEGGVNPGEALASVPTGSVVPTFTFTAPTGSFYVRVYALSGAFRSAASNDIRIHVNVPVAPSAPAHLLGQVDGSALALAWTNTYGGGEPTSLVLDVTGSIVTSLPLAFGDAVSFADVPAGTYTLALRAENAGGISPPSNAVTLAIPGPCSGPPLVPSNVLAYRVGRIVFVDWAPATSGPAPTGYLLDVTGTAIASFETSERALTGTVGPGSYTLRVVAVNACGASAGTPPQTVVVP
jgi:Tol biopolymer transport system component